MNVDKLESGMIIKNYKELCLLLDENMKTGNSKKSQIKEFERFFSYRKSGHSFIISEVFEKPKEELKIQRKPYYSLDSIPLNERILVIDTYGKESSNVGLYSNAILKFKCNECDSNFDKEAKSYFRSSLKVCDYCIQSKYSKLIFKCLSNYKLQFATEHSFEDLKVKISLRFDYAIFNNGKLITLIEYDGEYHDFQDRTIINDKLKDEYCNLHNIPLLRVHHTNTDIVKTVSEYLLKLGLISNDMMTAYLSKVKLQELNKKLEKNISNRMKLDVEFNEIKNMINELENAKL